MKSILHMSWWLAGLILLTSLEGCMLYNSRPAGENSGARSTQDIANATAATELITRYYQCQINGDYIGAYHCLSRQSQMRLPRDFYISKARKSNTSFVQLKSVTNIHVEQQTDNRMLVRYSVNAIINEAEAALLRKAGHPDAKPGLHLFTNTGRELIYEEGKWVIQAPK